MAAMSNDMEEQHTPPSSSPFPRWPDARGRPPPSQWLHFTLSELDEKIKIILDLIDDNGNTFAKRAEMYYQRRPQLIKMVQDLHGSYKELADKYDHLGFKFEPSISSSSTTSLTNSFRRECEEETARQTDDWINKRMKFSKLWEENLMKLSELIRKNDENREVINELRDENRGVINEVKNENMIWKREVINELRNENRGVINELKNENMIWKREVINKLRNELWGVLVFCFVLVWFFK